MSGDVKGREHLVRRQQALTAVFKRFGAVWPRAFGASAWPTLMEPWLDALSGVDTDVLEPAARELLKAGQHPYPPKPWEFAKMARQLARQHAPDVLPRGGDGPIDAGNVGGKQVARVEALSNRARERLGSWPLVSEVWGMLWKTAQTDEERTSVRNGTLPDDLFDDAVRIVAAQRGAA